MSSDVRFFVSCAAADAPLEAGRSSMLLLRTTRWSAWAASISGSIPRPQPHVPATLRSRQTVLSSAYQTRTRASADFTSFVFQHSIPCGFSLAREWPGIVHGDAGISASASLCRRIRMPGDWKLRLRQPDGLGYRNQLSVNGTLGTWSHLSWNDEMIRSIS